MEIRDKHAKWPQDHGEEEDCQTQDLIFVIGEGRSLVQDAVCDESCHHAAMGHEQGRERGRYISQESYAAAPIRMQRNKIQIEPGDVKQKPEPNENAVIPAKEHKLKNR